MSSSLMERKEETTAADPFFMEMGALFCKDNQFVGEVVCSVCNQPADKGTFAGTAFPGHKDGSVLIADGGGMNGVSGTVICNALKGDFVQEDKGKIVAAFPEIEGSVITPQ